MDFYLQYGFPLYKDDYNRFRTGEMPLTILSYTFYNQLMVAAPEIKGLWEMAAVPGTRDENGNIVRSETASGTACMILAAAEQPEEVLGVSQMVDTGRQSGGIWKRDRGAAGCRRPLYHRQCGRLL